MGIELRATTFKLSDATLAKLEALQGRFSLVCANRTQVVRLAIDLLELIAFTKGSMDAVIRGIQGLLRISEFPLQSEFHFPAADSAAQGGAGLDGLGEGTVRPRVVSIGLNRPLRAVASEAFGTSFHVQFTPVNRNRRVA